MSELTGRGGPGRGQGRKPLPKQLRRVRCGFMTIPQWLADWLQIQDKPAGHIVEQALIEKYKLEEPGQDDNTDSDDK